MDEAEIKIDLIGQTTPLKSALSQRLQSPTQLRALLTAAVLLVAYFGIYQPLSGRISKSASKISAARKRLALADDIEKLRHQHEQFKDRIPAKADSNEWVQYVLNGIRGIPLKLVTMDATGTKELGPYKAVVLNVELEGQYHDVDAFLRWLELNDRLFRVDEMRFTPHRSGDGTLIMHVTLLGVMS